MSRVHDLLNAQIGHEFAASQQYVAIAVWYDQQALPQLAGHFYGQAVEERNHAMMIVQYLMDREAEVVIPGVPAVRNEFTSVVEPLELALAQERTVTQQFETLIALAREERDFLGEQFTHWFLKEQVEEISSMSTLLQVARRVGENVMLLEDYLAREARADGAADPTAPAAAGGAL
ncbi:MAG TPA: ferritin [Candidatus Nanopelagicales bacterium]